LAQQSITLRKAMTPFNFVSECGTIRCCSIEISNANAPHSNAASPPGPTCALCCPSPTLMIDI
jgi:hypothetical protein